VNSKLLVLEFWWGPNPPNLLTLVTGTMDRGWIDGRITAELIDIRKEYVGGIQDRVSVML
jgi:hypothetical protein